MELKIEYIDINELRHYDKNSKIHTREQIKHIANSIERFGFNDPIGIAGENNVILEGNGRIEAARLLGLKTLPCVRLDHLSEEEQQAYVIAHNAVNLETGFDDGVLYSELKKLQDYDFKEYGLKANYQLPEIMSEREIYKSILKTQTKLLVRNEFQLYGKYELPLIKDDNIDMQEVKLMAFTNARYGDAKNKDKTLHFFIHDYRFEFVYDAPEEVIDKIKQYRYLLTPDFSLYIDMPAALQIYNVFKNRWCGAYWQKLGLKVVPTISWSDEKSFDFCFEGIEKGSVVAVSTHGNKNCEKEFMKGYNLMLKKIEPRAIICYGKPFKEMQGNIITFPYNHCEGSEV